MRLIGIEPTHAAPEATALSTELQAHLYYNTILFGIVQVVFRKCCEISCEKLRNTVIKTVAFDLQFYNMMCFIKLSVNILGDGRQLLFEGDFVRIEQD